MNTSAKQEDKRPRYPFVCPKCQKTVWGARSIAQEGFGYDEGGHGSCPHCHTFLHLTFVPDESKFNAEPWSEWHEKILENNKNKPEIYRRNIETLTKGE